MGIPPCFFESDHVLAVTRFVHAFFCFGRSLRPTYGRRSARSARFFRAAGIRRTHFCRIAARGIPLPGNGSCVLRRSGLPSLLKRFRFLQFEFYCIFCMVSTQILNFSLLNNLNFLCFYYFSEFIRIFPEIFRLSQEAFSIPLKWGPPPQKQHRLFCQKGYDTRSFYILKTFLGFPLDFFARKNYNMVTKIAS